MKQILLTTIAAVLLVGCGESTPDISIWKAALNGDEETVKQHLAAGTNVNGMGDWGTTPLHLAAGKGHREIVELLIAGGADVNARDDIRGTPLYGASDGGYNDIVELLLAKGADVNARGFLGITPLDKAVGNTLNDKNNAEAAALLHKHCGKTGEELKAEGK